MAGQVCLLSAVAYCSCSSRGAAARARSHACPLSIGIWPLPNLPHCLQKYWASASSKPYRFVTGQMIQEAFHRTPHWRAMEAELGQPFKAPLAGQDSALTTKK